MTIYNKRLLRLTACENLFENLFHKRSILPTACENTSTYKYQPLFIFRATLLCFPKQQRVAAGFLAKSREKVLFSNQFIDLALEGKSMTPIHFSLCFIVILCLNF